MKKLLEAHLLGNNGHELQPGASKAERIAHTIGRHAFDRITAENTRLFDEKRAEFNEAVSVAKGPNKILLQIMEEAASLPQRASNPLWGARHMDRDRSNPRQVRSAHYRFGADQSPIQSHETPVKSRVEPILIDSPDWAHNGYNTPVDSIGITSTARLGEDGRVLGVSSTLFINGLGYNSDNITFDDANEYEGKARIDIDEDGELTIGLARSMRTGYTPSDSEGENVTVELNRFLESVKGAISQSAVAELEQAYEGGEPSEEAH